MELIHIKTWVQRMLSKFLYSVHCASGPMIEQGDLGKDYTSKPKPLSTLGWSAFTKQTFQKKKKPGEINKPESKVNFAKVNGIERSGEKKKKRALRDRRYF